MRNVARNWLAGVTVLLLTACSTLNPVSRAETTEQKSWALYGTYVVFQEQAASLVKDPAVPADVKQRLQAADRISYPIANGLFNAGQEVIIARRLLEQDATGAEKVDLALRNLSEWYIRAQPVVADLVAAVQGD